MTRTSVQPRDLVFVKGYGLLSFAKNIGRNICKNVSKNVSGKYSKKLTDHYCLKLLITTLNILLQKGKFSRSNWGFYWQQNC